MNSSVHISQFLQKKKETIAISKFLGCNEKPHSSKTNWFLHRIMNMNKYLSFVDFAFLVARVALAEVIQGVLASRCWYTRPLPRH